MGKSGGKDTLEPQGGVWVGAGPVRGGGPGRDKAMAMAGGRAYSQHHQDIPAQPLAYSAFLIAFLSSPVINSNVPLMSYTPQGRERHTPLQAKSEKDRMGLIQPQL